MIMSDFTNPYQSPENPSVPEKLLSPQAALTEPMLRYLKEAAPWLRFMGVLGYIGCGFMFFGGIILSIIMFAVSGFIDGFDGASMGIMGLVYVPMGILYFFPARFTYKFGTKIRHYLFTNSEEDLELAFKNNRALWKFNGILYIVLLAFIPLFIVLAVVGGVAAAMSGAFF
jgi:hypothetical protein